MDKIKKLKLVSKISKLTGFTSICYFLNRNKKRIIAYHNVIEDELFDNSIHLEHSMKKSSFLKQIKIIKERFGISLDIENFKEATLTFDDGYFNQYEIGAKALDNIGVQGYFFCVENLINKNEAFFIDLIQFWISYVDCKKYSVDKFNIELDIENDRRGTWEKISKMIERKKFTQFEILNEMNSIEPISKIIKKKEKLYKLRFKAISKEDLEKMKKKGHLIGAHSANHLRLSDLSDNELKEDIKKCKSEINKIYNTTVFCYPYGSYEDVEERGIEEVKRQGFTKGISYSNSPLKNGRYSKFFIPRMFIMDTDDDDLINFVLSGAKHMISFRKLLP